MAQFDPRNHTLVGPGGELSVPEDDEISRKLLMLIEGECGEAGPLQAAQQVRFQQAALLSTPHRLPASRAHWP